MINWYYFSLMLGKDHQFRHLGLGFYFLGNFPLFSPFSSYHPYLSLLFLLSLSKIKELNFHPYQTLKNNTTSSWDFGKFRWNCNSHLSHLNPFVTLFSGYFERVLALFCSYFTAKDEVSECIFYVLLFLFTSSKNSSPITIHFLF